MCQRRPGPARLWHPGHQAGLRQRAGQPGHPRAAAHLPPGHCWRQACTAAPGADGAVQVASHLRAAATCFRLHGAGSRGVRGPPIVLSACWLASGAGVGPRQPLVRCGVSTPHHCSSSTRPSHHPIARMQPALPKLCSGSIACCCAGRSQPGSARCCAAMTQCASRLRSTWLRYSSTASRGKRLSPVHLCAAALPQPACDSLLQDLNTSWVLAGSS